MARDYKYRARRRKKRAKLSPWIGVISGLIIGLFVAFLVYIKMQTPLQPAAVYQESILPPPEQTRPATETAAPQPQTPTGPRFDFYTLLPEMEVVVPEEEIPPPPPPAPITRHAADTAPAPLPAAKPATAPRPAPSETYLLQVGSFRNGQQAERFRAELGILGLQTSIQTVTIDNRDTYHRVRVGPFHNSVALNQARSRLREQNIESQVIKLTK